MAGKYLNTPGTPAEFNDGNLNVTNLANGPTYLIIGTGTKGPTDQVVPLSGSKNPTAIFGDGTISTAFKEARAARAGNIYGFRLGGTTAKVTGIGDSTGVSGLTVETQQKDNTAGDNYYISWTQSTKRLRVWDLNGVPVYDNVAGIDSGVDVWVYGSTNGVTGPSFGSATAGVLMSSLDEDEYGYGVGLQYVAGTDGSTYTRRQLFEVLQDAYRTLETLKADVVAVPGLITLDAPNIADDADLANTSGDFLGWFKEEYNDGEYTYSWSSAATKPEGFHEVNFAYQLAAFCDNATREDAEILAVIGVEPPSDTSKRGIARWVGTPPTVSDATGAITDNGTGLLGNKFMAGSTNQSPGFFRTNTGFLDGNFEYDENEEKVDIGKHLSVVVDFVRFTDGNSANPYGYVAPLAATYGGMITALDPLNSPTNKALPAAVRPIYITTRQNRDDLIAAGYVTAHTNALNVFVVTSAVLSAKQDYKQLTTTRIAFDTLRGLRSILTPYIGNAFTSRELSAAQSQCNNFIAGKIQGGYLKEGVVTLLQTTDEAVLGELDAVISLIPAFELKRVNFTLSLRKV